MIRVRNPLLPGCHPDPSICRAGEWYYLVCSTFEYLPGIPVMRSRDLVRWETVGHAIDRSGMLDLEGIASSGGLYAPTIRYGVGRFWIACTLVDRQDPDRGGNFVVTAVDPAGPWSDPVWLDAEGIDPSIAFDDAGRVWMHGTRPARSPQWPEQTEVWVREYSSDEERLIGAEHVIWRGAVHGAVWAEGPHLSRIDGHWYLVAAEGGTQFHHAVCVARADEVTGPYAGYRGNPVLTHRHLGRDADVIAAGHADLVQAPDGSWIAVLLAMRAADGRHSPLGRETFLCPVMWQDGWPVFAPGEGRLPRAVGAAWARTPVPDGSWQPDDRRAGVVEPLDPRWTSLRVPPSEIARPEAGAWRVPVRAASLRDASRVSFLGIRQQHPDVDAEAVLDVTGLAEGERAGFAVRQSERDHVVVQVARERDGVVLAVIHRSGGEERRLAGRRLGDRSRVELGLRARGYAYELVSEGEALASVDARELDAASTGGFLGLWLGVFATSDGAVPRGEIRLEEFRYEPAGVEVGHR